MPDEPLISRLGIRGTVVVRPEIDGFLVQIFEHLVADPGHADFGVTHRRGAVAVDRTEVALTIDQHVAQREILRHADNRVINCGIAVRMVFTDDVTDDTRRFLVCLVPVVVELVHREQYAAMHRLQAVARIRQRPADDYAHRVIEIGTPHLVFEADRQCFFGELVHVSHSHRLRDALLVESSVICYFNTRPTLKQPTFPP